MSKASKEKLRLEMGEESHPIFDPTAVTKLMTSKQLHELVNSVFSRVFSDFEGSTIRFNSDLQASIMGGANPALSGGPLSYNFQPPGNIVLNDEGVDRRDVPPNQFYLTLYFKDKPSDTKKIKTLEQIHPSKPGDPLSLKHRYNLLTSSQTRSRVFNVTEDTKEILEEFMYVNKNDGPPRDFKFTNDFWNRHIIEESIIDNRYLNTSKEISIVRITGLNLIPIISRIFGEENEDGEAVVYRITPFNPNTVFAPSVVNNPLLDVGFQIDRLETSVFNEFLTNFGYSRTLNTPYVPV